MKRGVECHMRESQALRPLHALHGLNDLRHVGGEVLNPLHATACAHVPIAVRCHPAHAVVEVHDVLGSTEEERSHLHTVRTQMHCLGKCRRKLLCGFPSCGSKAATAIKDHDHINLHVAFNIGVLHCQLEQGIARHCVARLVLKTLLVILFEAFALTICFLCNSTHTLLEATVAHLVAITPLSPIAKSAIPVAAVHVAILGLSQLSTWRTLEGRVHINGARLCTDSATARSTARAPAAPIVQNAVDGAGIDVARLLHPEWWASCSIAWCHQDLTSLHKDAPSASLCAGLLTPLRHLAIDDVGHEDLVITFDFLQLHADLLQATDLGGVCIDVLGTNSRFLTLL
mmetsp:Transcript_49391/g.91107  ORF Transcript_49391/g.91107 Transcript_49391/m.91107 type:complete len:343 (+) Transcript_49391:691-1719(+)